MELPHLTLYLRRLGAALPLRQGPRAVLATPRGWVYACTGFWLLLAAGWATVWPSMEDLAYASNYYALVGGLELIKTGLVFLANWMMYFAATQAAANLAGEPRAARQAGVRQLGDPAWYATLLPSSSAVWGQLCAGMIACLPIGLAVFCFSLVDQITENITYGVLYEGRTGLNWVSLLEFNLLYVLRIPQLMLFTMALSIALRRSSLVASVPWLVTLVAALAAEVEGRTSQPWFYAIQRDPFGAGRLLSMWTVIGGTVLLCLAAWALLRWVSSRERASWTAYTALLFLCGVPLMGFAVVIAEYYVGQGQYPLQAQWTVIYHAFLATFLPDLHPFTLPQAETPLGFYGWDFQPAIGLGVVAVAYAASFATWWAIAVSCLETARGRRGG